MRKLQDDEAYLLMKQRRKEEKARVKAVKAQSAEKKLAQKLEKPEEEPANKLEKPPEMSTTEPKKKSRTQKFKEEFDPNLPLLLPERIEMSGEKWKLLKSDEFAMRSVEEQAKTILDLGMRPWKRRDEAKKAATERCKEKGLGTNSYRLGRETGIHSFKSRENIESGVKKLLEFCRDQEKLDMVSSGESRLHPKYGAMNITAAHVEAFFTYEFVVQKQSKEYLDNLSGGLNKFFSIMERIDGHVREADWIMKDVYAEAEPMISTPRAYKDIGKILEKCPDSDTRILAYLQYSQGLRATELVNFARDGIYGDMLLTNTKGGRIRSLPDPEAFEQFVEKIGKEHIMEVAKNFRYNTYRWKLELAVKCCRGEKWHGTHGLRWSKAQDLYADYIRCGADTYEAELLVAENLGHGRRNITRRYLQTE